jgi:hypothetical protein
MLSRRTRKDHTGSERTARGRPGGGGALVESLEGRQLFAATLFTLDPAQKRHRALGSAVGFDLKRQDDASLRAKYDGFIVADVTADTIQFPGGSEVAAEMRGSFDPATPPANYAAAVDGPFKHDAGRGRPPQPRPRPHVRRPPARRRHELRLQRREGHPDQRHVRLRRRRRRPGRLRPRRRGRIQHDRAAVHRHHRADGSRTLTIPST